MSVQAWNDRHAKHLEMIKSGGGDLLFVGDSITEGWGGAGKEVWAKEYAPGKAINIGIGGDTTQNVLWRLANGEVEVATMACRWPRSAAPCATGKGDPVRSGAGLIEQVRG